MSVYIKKHKWTVDSSVLAFSKTHVGDCYMCRVKALTEVEVTFKVSHHKYVNFML